MSTDNLTRRVAEVMVLDAYDRGRRAGYMDLGGSRRRVAIARRAARIDHDLDRAGILTPVVTLDELVEAFHREAARRLARRDGQPASVRNALRRAAIELGREHGTGRFALVLGRLGVTLSGPEFIRDRSRKGREVMA